MRQQEKILGCLLIVLLLISLTGNVALFLWIRQARNLAAAQQIELESLRQEVEELRQELQDLRSQAENKILFQEKMNLVAKRTETLRQLESQTPVTRRLVSREEMGQVVLQKVEEEYTLEDIRQDEIVLATLELIPPDLDIYQMITGLLEEQVAGLYDPDDETFYVVSYRGRMGALEKITFAHEYTHALQDQRFDLEALGIENEQANLNDDQLLAIHALVEGDATLSMQQYMTTHFTPLEMLGLVGAALGVDQTALNQAPPYLRKSLMFPYQDGLFFATYLYQQGGWPAVNKVYTHPPQSSEQILHPTRYPDDLPQGVTIPPLTDTLGSSWQLVTENVLGEFALGVYLDVYLTKRQAAQAAQGWGGDRYAVYQNPVTEQVLLALLLAWDNQSEQDEFANLYQEYAQLRFGDEVQQVESTTRTWWVGKDTLLLAQNNNQSQSARTLIVLAPDVTVMEQVLKTLSDF